MDQPRNLQPDSKSGSPSTPASFTFLTSRASTPEPSRGEGELYRLCPSLDVAEALARATAKASSTLGPAEQSITALNALRPASQPLARVLVLLGKRVR